MEERFRVLEENGYAHVERTVQILEENGYIIKRLPKESEIGSVPFCEGADGKPVMLPGWSIVAERPSQPATTSNNDRGYAAPWLW